MYGVGTIFREQSSHLKPKKDKSAEFSVSETEIIS